MSRNWTRAHYTHTMRVGEVGVIKDVHLFIMVEKTGPKQFQRLLLYDTDKRQLCRRRNPRTGKTELALPSQDPLFRDDHEALIPKKRCRAVGMIGKKNPEKRCAKCGGPRAVHRILAVGDDPGIRYICRACCDSLDNRGTKKR